MASIYKRKRIYVPKMFNKFKKEKNKKIGKFLFIVCIMLITFLVAYSSICPIIDSICKDKAKSIATIICNEESTKIIANYQYEDLITVYKDSDDNITMVKSNIVPINYIISDVAEKIQKRMNETHSESAYINLGSLTGNRILSGLGPKIPIKLSLVGNVETDLRSEFISHNINQTIHRIYLQIECEIAVLIPYNIIEEKISNQVLIAENIIVGKVPETYYNLEGITEDDVMEVM